MASEIMSQNELDVRGITWYKTFLKSVNIIRFRVNRLKEGTVLVRSYFVIVVKHIQYFIEQLGDLKTVI